MTPAAHREQLIGMLCEAAEIEHCLMLTYLYAAFSLKDRDDEAEDDPALDAEALAAVRRWRGETIRIAQEEMLHLALVNNLLIAVGGRPHYRRFNFPIGPGTFPADVVAELAPFDAQTLDHFIYLERPRDAAEHDARRLEGGKDAYTRRVQHGRLMAFEEDYDTVGELYETIGRSVAELCARIGEDRLFTGPVDAQLTTVELRLPGLRPIASLADARDAIHLIVDQGEGAVGDDRHSHYVRFCAMREEWRRLAATRPGFRPWRPAARNPVMRAPVVDPAARVHVICEPAASLLDAGNACYVLMLRLLSLLTDRWLRPAVDQRTVADQTVLLMRLVAEIGTALTRLPANPSRHPGVNAGLTFTAPRTEIAFQSAGSAASLIHERCDEIACRLRELSDHLPALSRLADRLDEIGRVWVERTAPVVDEQGEANPGLSPRDGPPPGTADTPAASRVSPGIAPEPTGAGELLVEDGASPAAAEAERGEGDAPAGDDRLPDVHAEAAHDGPPSPAPVPPDTETDTPKVDVAEGERITIRFDHARCIHARFCVLGEPDVFAADTPGQWIFPDRAHPDAIARVAHNCPSGAITYTRHDGDAEEAAPRVNLARIRENGPLAVNAPMRLRGEPIGLRAVLCRCGLSGNKPFCDGSHAEGGFVASGEPETRPSSPLAARDGTVDVEPVRNGPLEVLGNLEVVSGTGRTVDRLTGARLCRCGQSRHKPFCDDSHLSSGFTAD